MIRIDGLKKEYKDFTLDVSLEFESGTINGIVGTNGAGKSTLFKSILGLIFYKEGSIEINGKNVKDFKYEDKEKIGCVMTESFFSETFTVKDIASIMNATYKTFDKDKFFKKCEKYKLPTDKRIKEFSNGMKAKLKIITALSYDTDLLILDEPTVGLDVIARDDILDEIREYMEADENRTVLISSHISSDIEKLCDTTFMIHNGKIVFNDDTDRLLCEYAALKLDEETFEKIDKSHIKAYRKEKYGYECLTDARDYYVENYPSIVVEKMSVDEMMMIIIKGERS
jgi:ABC-2 type transport system ATP-binding protein